MRKAMVKNVFLAAPAFSCLPLKFLISNHLRSNQETISLLSASSLGGEQSTVQGKLPTPGVQIEETQNDEKEDDDQPSEEAEEAEECESEDEQQEKAGGTVDENAEVMVDE